MSRSIHKWYPISGTHEDSKCSRNGFIDKFNKWFHGRRFFQMVSHLHVVSTIQHDGSTSDSQL
jgi:hypothetical protein